MQPGSLTEDIGFSTSKFLLQFGLLVLAPGQTVAAKVRSRSPDYKIAIADLWNWCFTFSVKVMCFRETPLEIDDFCITVPVSLRRMPLTYVGCNAGQNSTPLPMLAAVHVARFPPTSLRLHTVRESMHKGH
jgi:hypothetical protein